MPQLNPEFFLSQAFWVITTFFFLLFFLWKITLPKINKVLRKREDKINKDLESAKKLQVSAEELQNNINNSLAETTMKAKEHIKISIDKFNRDISEKIVKLDKDLENSINMANARIQKTKEESLKVIGKEVEELTTLSIKKIMEIKIDDNVLKNEVHNQINKNERIS